MSRRGAILELAVLGLLQEQPMHGYELRKRLSGVLGAFRAVSFGSLYPCLRNLTARGWITEHAQPTAGGKRPRISYELTAEGKEQFQTLIDQAGPTTWEDDEFGVHFAFFGRASTDVRLRILEGRRSRLEERLDAARQQARVRRERTDRYTAELQRHGLDSTEREVRWLTELIATERAADTPSGDTASGHTASSDTTATTVNTDITAPSTNPTADPA
ncbi:helix-turn-helix transcriptional regulator [Calidifontibacter terrae]